MGGLAATPGDQSGAVVRYRGAQWSLARGSVLTMGRSRTCDVRLPDDDHISRRAGSLRALDDCVLVRNDSASKPLLLRPRSGEDRVVEPGAGTTSLGHVRFTVVFTGRAGATAEIFVDASALAASSLPVNGTTTRGPVTVNRPLAFTAAQRRVLVTLCRPLLTRGGAEAVPASYAEIAEHLRLRPGYVRNVIKNIREELAGHGIPGLTPDDLTTPQDDFRWPLARWAVRSGCVVEADVADLAGTDS